MTEKEYLAVEVAIELSALVGNGNIPRAEERWAIIAMAEQMVAEQVVTLLGEDIDEIIAGTYEACMADFSLTKLETQ